METTTKKKRQVTPAQQLKAELKKYFPLLNVSCRYDTYSMGSSINVGIKNLHFTPYYLADIERHCKEFEKVRRDEYGDILSGGNTLVFVDNEIDKNIKAELDQMFIAYLSIYKEYQNIKTVEYNTLIELPSKHRETYQNLLDNQSYSELREPITEPKQETETEIMNTTETNETKTELELNNNIENEIAELNKKLTARNDLLIYLEKNNINGKIQQATEEEINEIKTEIEELTAKLDPRPKLKQRIKETKDFISLDLQKIADATAQENIADIVFFLNSLNDLKNDLEQDLIKLAEAEAKAETKNAIKSDFNEQDFIETKTAELVLTAPPTTNPQNVIELFPKKKTLDQLRKELNTPEAYQDLIDNYFEYAQKYSNLTVHGLHLIREDYSKKEEKGEISPSYEQWFKFTQYYQELIKILTI